MRTRDRKLKCLAAFSPVELVKIPQSAGIQGPCIMNLHLGFTLEFIIEFTLTLNLGDPEIERD